jgi:hypothetical protein
MPPESPPEYTVPPYNGEGEPCIRLDAEFDLAGGPHESTRRQYSARFIRAGRVRQADGQPGPFEIPADAIADAVTRGLLDSRPTFVDHPGWFSAPSLRDMAGVTYGAEWNNQDQSADGYIKLYDNPAGNIVAGLFDAILADAEEGEAIPDVGLSLVFYPLWAPRDNHDEPLRLKAFRQVVSIDFVFYPAADGRVKEALTALSALTLGQPAADPDPGHSPGPNPIPAESPSSLPGELPLAQEVTHMPPEERITDPTQDLEQNTEDWAQAMIDAARDAVITGSGLPAAAQEMLRSQSFDRPSDLEAAIEAQRAMLAELQADAVVQVGDTPPRSSGIALGRNGLEQITAAFDALLEGTRPPDGIQPLTGIREFYHLMSGDYEMTGLFQGDRVYLANVTSSTMAGLVANRLNKRVINLFASYPAWWAPIVTEEDFNNLQQVRWVTLGGVGELPTVAEGAAYTELTWDDQTETADFVKKGGYLGITLEAIDKDDTTRLRAAPRALAQGAWLTVGKLVSGIFTDNSGVGPTMSDSIALFNASHSNLGTTALSWTEYGVVKIAMMKQTEVNSGERLGALTAPKYILVPIDLENTALGILAAEGKPGTADNDENIYAEGDAHNARMDSARSRVITVPLWTDTNNWAAVADPKLYPSIGIGYRYGRAPEIFSVASPTAGLMFTNDTMPVKVRFFVAVGPTDYRGLYKENVS